VAAGFHKHKITLLQKSVLGTNPGDELSHVNEQIKQISYMKHRCSNISGQVVIIQDAQCISVELHAPCNKVSGTAGIPIKTDLEVARTAHF
jgi:hypothetical protein